MINWEIRSVVLSLGNGWFDYKTLGPQSFSLKTLRLRVFEENLQASLVGYFVDKAPWHVGGANMDLSVQKCSGVFPGVVFFLLPGTWWREVQGDGRQRREGVSGSSHQRSGPETTWEPATHTLRPGGEGPAYVLGCSYLRGTSSHAAGLPWGVGWGVAMNCDSVPHGSVDGRDHGTYPSSLK